MYIFIFIFILIIQFDESVQFDDSIRLVNSIQQLDLNKIDESAAVQSAEAAGSKPRMLDRIESSHRTESH